MFGVCLAINYEHMNLPLRYWFPADALAVFGKGLDFDFKHWPEAQFLLAVMYNRTCTQIVANICDFLRSSCRR